jgi:hypothetical protein
VQGNSVATGRQWREAKADRVVGKETPNTYRSTRVPLHFRPNVRRRVPRVHTIRQHCLGREEGDHDGLTGDRSLYGTAGS